MEEIKSFSDKPDFQKENSKFLQKHRELFEPHIDKNDDTEAKEEIKRRSITNITDDNYDEEFEKLCDLNGYRYDMGVKFVEKLPDGFHEVNVESAKDSDYVKCVMDWSGNEEYQAYKFANGFMILSTAYCEDFCM